MMVTTWTVMLYNIPAYVNSKLQSNIDEPAGLLESDSDIEFKGIKHEYEMAE